GARRHDREPSARPLGRYVRANAATAEADRVQAAVIARDLDALLPLLADIVEVVDHPTGGAFDGRAVVATWRSFLRASNPLLEHEALATLRGSLAPSRSAMSFDPLAQAHL